MRKKEFLDAEKHWHFLKLMKEEKALNSVPRIINKMSTWKGMKTNASQNYDTLIFMPFNAFQNLQLLNYLLLLFKHSTSAGITAEFCGDSEQSTKGEDSKSSRLRSSVFQTGSSTDLTCREPAWICQLPPHSCPTSFYGSIVREKFYPESWIQEIF